MFISDKYYTYNLTRRKQAYIKKKLTRQKPVSGLYVVVLPLFQDGLLEIYPYNQLLQPFYKSLSDKIRIVGVAKGKEQAQALVVDMIQDIYDATGDAFLVERFFFEEA